MFTTDFGGILGPAKFRESCIVTHPRGRRITASAGLALAVSLFIPSLALAQNCNLPANSAIKNLPAIGSSAASISAMVGSVITTGNTAFLLQSSAFVGSPPDPMPGQQGGGIWVRGVGGDVKIKSSTSTVVSEDVPPSSSTVTCRQTVDETFGGVQFGADVAKLNLNNWNLHFGATAGYLGTKGNLEGGALAYFDTFNNLPGGGGAFTNTTEIPFIGLYGAATYGGFAFDALLRTQYYQTSLTNLPSLGGQSIDARGIAFSSSMSYQWMVPNSNWFIEPSAGIIISRTKVDPFNYLTAGTIGVFDDRIPGTLQLNDVDSDIGRVGLRVGTTVEADHVAWQPFASVSVWHEFGPSITSNFATCNGCFEFVPIVGPPFLAKVTAASSTSNFGTYGQYSLGLSAALAGTGWLGFARVDYRDGPDLQGWSGTGGIRYQFAPDMAVASHAMPVKAPVYKAPVMTAVNWTGFYIGGFGGAAQGTADWGYAVGSVSPHIGGYLAGIDGGYNYQVGQYVLGVEADFEKTNTNGGMACGPFAVVTAGNTVVSPGPMLESTCHAWANWMATATARVGYTWDRALLYVKGGGALTNEHFSQTCNILVQGQLTTPCTGPTALPSVGLTANTDRGGWVIGTGTEYALTRNWSATAEADYISFGDTNVTGSDGSLLKVGMHLWQEKIGVNYRF